MTVVLIFDSFIRFVPLSTKKKRTSLHMLPEERADWKWCGFCQHAI